MGSFWHKYLDEDLTPLDLAEKRWALASDDQAKVIQEQNEIIRQQTAAMMGPYDRTAFAESSAKVDAANKAIEDEKKRVQGLELFWIGLKPYVPDTIKEALGCDMSKCVTSAWPARHAVEGGEGEGESDGDEEAEYEMVDSAAESKE